MEKNIYNKKLSFNMMKKIKIIFSVLILSLMVSSIHAGIMYNDNQDDVTETFSTQSVIMGTYSNLIVENETLISEDFVLTTTPMYLILTTGNDLISEEITISTYDLTSGLDFEKNYTVTGENLIIEITPQSINDRASFVLSEATGGVIYRYVFTNDDLREDETSIFAPLIAGVSDLIEINLTIWRLGFYAIIFLMFGALVALVFAVTFWIINKTKQINNDDGMMSIHGRNK